jgi:zinc D-Ala-D-Ala dipeptidase
LSTDRRAAEKTVRSRSRLRHIRALATLAPLVLPAPGLAGEPPPGFVRLADVAPAIKQDMRYAGAQNFTGRPVPGYGAAQCWLRAEAARALAKAQEEAHAAGFDLVVYDCYRPIRAVSAFFAWSQSPDEATKRDHYPNVEKRELFAQGYIALKSGHSTGLAVDLGVVGWNFGAPFDYFDRRSWTESTVEPAAHANRERLVALMRRHGFENFPREWWHFSLGGVEGAQSYDVPIE